VVTWGMVGNSHDAALAVFIDDKLVWACQSKDFSDVPNDPDFSWTQIEAARQSYGPPDRVVWYEKPFLKTLRQWRAGQGWLHKENNIKEYLKKWDIHCPIVYAKHHKSHAAYGWYTSGLPHATIMCLDSIGEFETFTIWKADSYVPGAGLKQVYSQSYPHSVGLFYSAMTQRCGFKPNAEEYKVAPAGENISTQENLHLVNDVIGTFIDTPLDGSKPGVKFKHNLHKGCSWYKPDLTTESDMKRLANATQFAFELILKSNSRWCRENLPSRNLILTGGCALNSVAVKQIKKNWDTIYVPKNPGDPGSCIGAVLAMDEKHIDFNDKIWYNKT